MLLFDSFLFIYLLLQITELTLEDKGSRDFDNVTLSLSWKQLAQFFLMFSPILPVCFLVYFSQDCSRHKVNPDGQPIKFYESSAGDSKSTLYARVCAHKIGRER